MALAARIIADALTNYHGNYSSLMYKQSITSVCDPIIRCERCDLIGREPNRSSEIIENNLRCILTLFRPAILSGVTSLYSVPVAKFNRSKLIPRPDRSGAARRGALGAPD